MTVTGGVFFRERGNFTQILTLRRALPFLGIESAQFDAIRVDASLEVADK